MKTLSVAVLLAGSIVCNVILGVAVASDRGTSPVTQGRFPYLSKRIFIEDQNDILINFTDLRTQIREYVGAHNEPIGVYFEYLPSGVSIGVNEQMEIKLASLVKIPIVMAVYKQIEAGTVSMDFLLTVRRENLSSGFGTLWKQGAGTIISVQKAIELSLVRSDNTASNVLLDLVGSGSVYKVFDSLDVSHKKKDGVFNLISPKSYSSILRSLYLSSYLEQEHSDAILEHLTKTPFTDKLSAPIPDSIPVAHKIGIFDVAGDMNKTHSDCGIIYVPERPYLLCIMTESTEDEAREYMSTLSEIVYEYVSRAQR